MGLRLQVEIKESQEELEKAVKYAYEASSKERLQMLYWLKSGQVKSRSAIAFSNRYLYFASFSRLSSYQGFILAILNKY